MKASLSTFLILLGFGLSTAASAQGVGPSSFNISGGLFEPSGAVVTNNSVDFRLEILDKNELCVLYVEEHQNVDLSTSKGRFSLELGRGINSANRLSGGGAFTNALFRNSGPTGAFTGCPAGVTLNSGDERVVRVSYDLGAGLQAMTPTVPIQSAAYSMVAETLGGKAASEFVQVRDDATYDLNQTNLESIFSAVNFAKLTQILSGNWGNTTLTNVGTPSAGTDAANKSYVDANIGGKIADVTTVGPAAGNGHTLIWDQAQNRWVTGVPSATDNTKLPLAGGTMTGAIAMGAQNITNIGHMTMAAQRTLNLGTYDDTQEGVLVGTLGAADKGKIWFNSQSNVFKVWNGTAAVSTFGASGAAGGDLTGTYPNPDIATGVVGSTELTDGGIATIDIANDAIMSAKINNTGIAVNRLLMTDATTGATVTYKTCALDETLKWTATGWACSTAAAFIGNTGVTAATYGNATQVSQVQVDAQGRIVTASNVNIGFPVVSVAGKTGAVTLNTADISGLGTAAVKAYGTAAGNLVELDGGGKIPASLLPSGTGDIGDVIAGTGLTGGGSSGAVTLAVDTGVTSGKIVAVGASDKLPAIDGSNLTQINAVKLQARNVASTAPTAAQVLTWNASNSTWEPQTVSVSNNGGFINGGNSFGAAATMGTNDNFALNFEANNATAMSVLPNGNVGIGTTNPSSALHIVGATTAGTIQMNNTTADATNKSSSIVNTHYTNAEESFVLMRASSGAVGNVLEVGGGNASFNTATQVSFFTAANNTTVMGTERLRIDSSGNVGVGTTSPQSLLHVNGVVRATDICDENGANCKDISGGWGGGGDIDGVYTSTGLVGGFASGSGTLSVDVGTTTGKIVQMAASNKLPAVDGSNLTGITATQVAGSFANNGNTFGAAATLGTNDNFAMNFEANGATAMTILPTGYVGLGTASPSGILDVQGGTAAAATNATNVNIVAQAAGAGNQNGGNIILNPGAKTGTGLFGAVSVGGAPPAWFGANANSLYVTNTIYAAILSGNTATVTTSLTTPIHYGSNVASGNLTLDSTSSVTKGQVHIAPSGGNVGVGTNNPQSLLHVNGIVRATDICDENGANCKDISGGWGGGGDIDGVYTSTGLVGGFASGSGTLSVDVGTTTGKIVQMAASDKLPAVDGSNLTGLIAAQVSGAFANNGNAFGATATLGTNDNFNLNFEANGATAMTILPGGNVGIGTAAPTSRLHVIGTEAGATGGTGVTSNFVFNPSAAGQSFKGQSVVASSVGATQAINNLTGLDLRTDQDSNSVAATNVTGVYNRVDTQDISTNLFGYQLSSYYNSDVNTASWTGFASSMNTSVSSLGNITSTAFLDGSVVRLNNTTNAFGLKYSYTQWVTGTTTNAYGAYVDINRLAGTITNGYGVYLEDVESTNGFGIYQLGTNDKNYFAGNVGVGTNNPQSLLHVNGIIRATDICDENGANCKDISGGWGGGGDIDGVYSGTGLTGGFASGSGTLSVDVGTTTGKIVQVAASDKLPALDGSNLTAINAVQLQTRNVASTAPTSAQVLGWNAGNSTWEPQTISIYPTQTGNSGKFLMTNGTSPSWNYVSELADSDNQTKVHVDKGALNDNIIRADLNGFEVLTLSGSGGASATNSVELNLKNASSGSSNRIRFGNQGGGLYGYAGYDGNRMYMRSDNSIAFQTGGGTERVRIDASGNFGIGTNSPNAKLTVEGAMTLSQLAADPTGSATYGSVYTKTDGKLYYRDGTGTITDLLASSTSGFANGGNSFGAAATLGTNDNFAMNFEANGATAMTIVPGGSVGIGTAAPNSPLDVVTSGSGTVVKAFNLGSTSTTNGSGVELAFNISSLQNTTSAAIQAIRTNSPSVLNSDLAFTTHGGGTSEKVRITSTGNVGIGTTTPNQLLTVEGPMSLRAQAAPTLTANYGKVYVDSGDANKLKYMNPAGTITDLTAGGSPSLSGLAAASATNTIANGSFAQAWNWDALTTQNAMSLGTNSATTGTLLNLTNSFNSATSTGNVLKVTTTGTSNAAVPLMITNAGAGKAFRVNDNGTDTDASPFVIDENGNVGIGTATPLRPLHISQGFAPATAKFLTDWSGQTFTDGGEIGMNALNEFTLWNFENSSIVFHTNGSERARILGNGNVGIGTASPNQLLTVEGPMSLRAQAAPTLTANYGKIYVDSGDSNKLKYMNPAGAITDLTAGAGSAFVNGGNSFAGTATIGTNDNNPLAIEVNGTTKAMVWPNGNFSFLASWAGGYSPSRVAGWDTNLDGITVENTTSSNNNGAQLELLARNTGGTEQRAYIGAVSAAAGYTPNIIFGQRSGLNAYDERMRIDTAGNVGIGTAAPTSPLMVERSAPPSRELLTLSNPETHSWGAGGKMKFQGVSGLEMANVQSFWDLDTSGAYLVFDVRVNNTMKNAIMADRWGPNNHPHVSIGGYPAGGRPTAPRFSVLTESTGGNNVANGLMLHHVDSDSAASSGIGNSITFVTESTSSDTHVETASITSVLTDATNTSKDGILTFATLGPNAAAGSNSATERMRIDSSGNVGIGTTSPNQLLTVEGPMSFRAQAAPTLTANYGKIYVDSGDSNKLKYMNPAGTITDLTAGGGSGFANGGNSYGAAATLGTNDNYAMNFEANGATAMTILPSGNVGIGTTGPAQLLQVSGSTGDASILIQESAVGQYQGPRLLLNRTTGGTDSEIGLITFESSAIAQITAWTDPTSDTGSEIRFLTDLNGAGPALTQKMVIKENGNVGIGTTAPEALLDVAGAVAANSSHEGIVAYVNSGTSYTIPDVSYNIRRISLTGNATITLPAYTAPAGKVFNLTIFLRQDATGNRTVTFAGNGADTIKWDSGTAPVISATANRITIIQLMKPADETVWYGAMSWREN